MFQPLIFRAVLFTEPYEEGYPTDMENHHPSSSTLDAQALSLPTGSESFGTEVSPNESDVNPMELWNFNKCYKVTYISIYVYISY